MDVSVIIVNYNTLALTRQCVDSIFEKTSGLDFEVIVVDNGSTDGSREYFSQDDRIRYVYSVENLGFGRANNLGETCAKGEFLFFLNSDTYFLNNALLYFMTYVKSCKMSRLGFVGTLLKDVDGKINGYGDDFPSIMKSLKMAAHICWPPKKSVSFSATPFMIDYVLGADLFVRKELFDELNGFDEDFFMYYEESDLQCRSHKKGFCNFIIDSPNIVHLEGKSISNLGVAHSKRMMVERSHLLYHRKHYSKIKFDLFLLLYFVLRSPKMIDCRYRLSENIEYLALIIKQFQW